MSDSGGKFTVNEIRELNLLLRSMNDAHRNELGDFRRFLIPEDASEYPRFGEPTFGEASRHDEEYLLSILRQIQMINQENDEDCTTGRSVLKLDFYGAFDESLWPDGFMYDYDRLDMEFRDHYESQIYDAEELQNKFRSSEMFIRGNDFDDVYVNCRSKSNQERGIRGLGCMIHSLPQSVNLVSLNIARNEITSDDAIAACNALKGLASLTELDMSHNRIGEDGGRAIFSTLLGDPSCKIQKLSLHNNHLRRGSVRGEDPTLTLVRVLQSKNRSLVELNLSKTGFRASGLMISIFIGCNTSDKSSLFDYVGERNHHLKVLKVGENLGSRAHATLVKSALSGVLEMNKDGPEQAIATKIGHYFNREGAFSEDVDMEYIIRCLEFVGIYGDLFTLMRVVRNFQAQGSLFDHNCRDIKFSSMSDC